MLYLRYDGKAQVSDFRYLRTSFRQVKWNTWDEIYFVIMAHQGGLAITKIISSKQKLPWKKDIGFDIADAGQCHYNGIKGHKDIPFGDPVIRLAQWFGAAE